MDYPGVLENVVWTGEVSGPGWVAAVDNSTSKSHHVTLAIPKLLPLERRERYTIEAKSEEMLVEAGLQEESVSQQRSGEVLLEEGPCVRFSRSQHTSLFVEQSGGCVGKDGGRGVMAMGKGRAGASGFTYECDTEGWRIF